MRKTLHFCAGLFLPAVRHVYTSVQSLFPVCAKYVGNKISSFLELGYIQFDSSVCFPIAKAIFENTHILLRQLCGLFDHMVGSL